MARPGRRARRDRPVAVRPRRLPRLVPGAQRRRGPTTGTATTSSRSSRTRPRKLTVGQLRPFHVQQWVDAHPGWKTGKRGAIIAVQRAFNWAAKMGLIESSPIRHVEKPRAGRRDASSPPTSTRGSSPWSGCGVPGPRDRLLGDRLPAAGDPLRRGPARRPGRVALGLPARRVEGQEAGTASSIFPKRRSRSPSGSPRSGRGPALPEHRRAAVERLRAQLPLRPAPPGVGPRGDRAARARAAQDPATD